MGWMTRHAIVVTAISAEYIKPAHAKALEIFGRSSSIPDCPVPWDGKARGRDGLVYRLRHDE